MILVYDDLCIRKESPGQFCVGKPHITYKEFYFQPFLSRNVSPVISQMTLSTIWQDIQNQVFLWINENTLIFPGRGITSIGRRLCRAPPETFDSTFGLRRFCKDKINAQLMHRTPELSKVYSFTSNELINSKPPCLRGTEDGMVYLNIRFAEYQNQGSTVA